MDSATSMQTISVPMQSMILRLDDGGPKHFRCLRCNSELDLCQPDVDAPDRLLGTCHTCWRSHLCLHVINLIDDSAAVVLLLPSVDALRDAIDDAGVGECAQIRASVIG